MLVINLFIACVLEIEQRLNVIKSRRQQQFAQPASKVSFKPYNSPCVNNLSLV